MARAASTDGHNETYERSSCLPAAAAAQWPAGSDPLRTQAMCSLHFDLSTGQQQPANVPRPGFLQSGGTATGRFKTACQTEWVPTCQSLAHQDSDFQVEALAGDVMAGAGGAAGPAPYVRHQPPGDVNEESRAC